MELVEGNGRLDDAAVQAQNEEVAAISMGIANLIMEATENNFKTPEGKAEYATALCGIVPLIVDAIIVGVNKERDGQQKIITT